MTFDSLFMIDDTASEPDQRSELEIKLWDTYGQAWSNVRVKDSEYPPEDICANCKGCGTFKNSDGEEKECFMDREEGECYHRYFDAELFGLEVEQILNK